MADTHTQVLFRAGTESGKSTGPKVLGTIDLSQFDKKKR